MTFFIMFCFYFVQNALSKTKEIYKKPFSKKENKNKTFLQHLGMDNYGRFSAIIGDLKCVTALTLTYHIAKYLGMFEIHVHWSVDDYFTHL